MENLPEVLERFSVSRGFQRFFGGFWSTFFVVVDETRNILNVCHVLNFITVRGHSGHNLHQVISLA